MTRRLLDIRYPIPSVLFKSRSYTADTSLISSISVVPKCQIAPPYGFGTSHRFLSLCRHRRGNRTVQPVNDVGVRCLLPAQDTPERLCGEPVGVDYGQPRFNLVHAVSNAHVPSSSQADRAALRKNVPLDLALADCATVVAQGVAFVFGFDERICEATEVADRI